MEEQKTSLRDHIENAMEQVEAGVEPVEAESIEVAPVDDIAEETKENRDEAGRFVAKEQSEPTEADQAQIEEVMADPEIKRPTTWKKEYLTLWDKAYEGQPLTKEEGRKLTAYLDQRETEYKRGVSTYRQEAERAKQYEEAINPFVSDLQARNINPATYIQALAKADQLLTYANPQQKEQYFRQLAQSYGIQLNQGGQFQELDPYAQQLNQALQQNQQRLDALQNRLDAEDTAKMAADIERFASNTKDYPHFEALRDTMSQLLGRQEAHDLHSAYEQAKWQVAEVRDLEIKRQIERQTSSANRQAQVQKAKAAAVSVRSTTPSGTVADGVDKKDRRAVMSALIDESFGRL